MSATLNHWGKTPHQCTCGMLVNLEPHEYQDWLTRHSAMFTGMEHKLKVIGPPHQPDSIPAMVTSLMQALHIQGDDMAERIRLMVQKEVSNALPQGKGK